MASIKQRGASWRAVVKHKGERFTATFDTQREAKAWAVQLESRLINRPDPPKFPDKTLHEAFDRYCEEVAIHHKGYRWEKIRLDRIKREIANVPLRVLNEGSLLSDWRNARMEVVGKGSIRREMTLLRLVFEVAKREWKWLSVNPIDGLKRPPMPKHRDRIISQDEIDAVVEKLGYCGGSPSNQKQLTAVAFLLSIETAMRAGEILELRAGHVDLKNRMLWVVDSKNGDKREVPLSTRAMELLDSVMGKGDQLFPITPGVREQLFAKARAAAGFPTGREGGFTFHDARATALTRLSKKLDVLQLAKMVGHRDVKSLLIYFREATKDIALKLD